MSSFRFWGYSPIKQPFLDSKDNFEDDEETLQENKLDWMSLNGRSRDRSTRSLKFFVLLNIIWSLILLGGSLALLNSVKSHWRELGPTPPFSPVREDGFVRTVNKHFNYEPIFEGGATDEVDRAWNQTLGPSDGIVKLPKDVADKLVRSSEIYFEPGHYIYGVSMFHQLHCLNTIRQSFYPERYFPNYTKTMIFLHRNHCLEFLRQAIMCAGDVSMTYWWNPAYSFKDKNGVEHFTEEYLKKSPQDRAYGTYLMWDVDHQCKDFEMIKQWTEKNQLRDGLYKKESKNFRTRLPGEHPYNVTLAHPPES